MKVMRFVGRNSREAMRKLRDTLGPDALVLANRPCREGVELLATAPGSLGERAADAAPSRGVQAAAAAGAGGAAPDPATSMSTVSFQDYVRQRLRERNRETAGEAPAPTVRAAAAGVPVEAPGATEAAPRNAAGASWIAPPAASLAETLGDVQPGALGTVGFGEPPGGGHEALVAELQSLKGMISRQFATIGWFEGVRRSPVQGRLLRTMVGAGFSLKLARSVVTRLPSDYSEREAQVWLEEVLARNLRCAPPAEAFDAGGTFALIGPTGVGKTTTTAKIAARHVLKHGAQSVALITVDTYRLGAHDQLRAFGRILGVPVHVAHDASALHDLLRLRGTRQLVLIDTVGLGHRDERIRSLLLSLPRADIRHVVVANCSAQAETLDESLRAFEARQATGVVLTKLDEAARLGGALDCLLRQRLRLLGVCDGQRVPEDWHAPEASALVRRALVAPPSGAFALDDEELPLVFGVAATLQGDAVHA